MPEDQKALRRAGQLIEEKETYKKTHIAIVTHSNLRTLVDFFHPSEQLTTRDGWPLLLTCTMKGYTEGVSSLLSKGASLGVKNSEEENILYVSIRFKMLAIAKEALRIGDEREKQTANERLVASWNKQGNSPYYCACAINASDFVELMRPYVKEVDALNSEGLTPFLVACREGHAEALLLLKESKVNIHAVTRTGENGVHLAAKGNHFKVLELLKAWGVSFDHQNHENLTPLGYSKKYGTGEGGLWIEGKSSAGPASGLTARQALLKDREDVLRGFLDSGMDINANIGQGYTLFHLACKEQKLWAIKFLMGRGANLNSLSIESTRCLSPLSCMLRNANEACYPIIAEMIEKGAKLSSAEIAAFTKSSSKEQRLLEGVNNHLASVSYGEVRDAGAVMINMMMGDVNARDKKGYTLFLQACLTGDVLAVYVLKARRADIHAVSNTGENAAHLAALNNNFLILRTLKEWNVSISHRNSEGLGPAEYSVKHGTGEAGQWLQGKIEIPSERFVATDPLATPISSTNGSKDAGCILS